MKKGLFVIFCLMVYSLNAQHQINPVIRVERLYDADLIEVSKPALGTQVPDSLRTFHTLFEYSIFDKPIGNLYEFSPLPPAQLRPSASDGTRYAYLKAGVGYPWTPRADILLQVPLKSGWYIGMQARHRSLFTNDTRTTTNGIITLEHRGKNNTFRLYVPGAYLNNSFAVPDVLSSTSPFKNQSYYNIGGGIETFSLSKGPGTWHYYWKSEYSHAKNRIIGQPNGLWQPDNLPVIRENTLDIEAVAGYNLSHALRINLGGAALFASDKWSPDSTSASRATIHLFPHVILSGARYKVAAGVRIGYLLRPDNNKLGIFPWFDTHLVIAKDWLTLFAGVNGYQKLNTFQERIAENPWVTANHLYDAYVPWDVKAGFSGTVADRFSYQLYGAYRYTKNQFYYETQPIGVGYPGLYMLSYADETRYSAGASLSFHSRPVLAGISGEWHKYSLNTLQPPWHKPEWEIRGYFRYNWRERIVLSAHAYWRAACYVPAWDSPWKITDAYQRNLYEGREVVTLPSFFNLGVQAEYVISKKFSVYIFGDNLLNKEDWVFYLYPNPGLTLGGGITFRF